MENFLEEVDATYNVAEEQSSSFLMPNMFPDVPMDTSAFCSLIDMTRTPTQRPCKDVLRQAIRVSRIKKGQVMPVIDKESTVPKKRRKPLQGEIPPEMQVRREKNREAAKKCRLKKRKVMETLQKKIDKYESLNHELENEIKGFKKETSDLKRLFDKHKCIKDSRPQQKVQVGESNGLTSTTDIADSLDVLLSELQDNDRWCEELQNFTC